MSTNFSDFDHLIMTRLEGALGVISGDEIIRALIKDIGFSDVACILDMYAKEHEDARVIVAKLKYPTIG